MTPSIEILTPPTEECVSVDDLKSHLRLYTGDAEDAQLGMFISSARELFESRTGRIVLPTTFVQRESHWPPYGRGIKLLHGRCLEVSEAKYFDGDDVEQDIPNWQFDLTGTTGIVYVPLWVYPILSFQRPRPISITYTAGWPEADSGQSPGHNVPQSIRLAILLLAGFWYGQREAFADETFTELPAGFERLCQQWTTGTGWDCRGAL